MLPDLTKHKADPEDRLNPIQLGHKQRGIQGQCAAGQCPTPGLQTGTLLGKRLLPGIVFHLTLSL